MTRYLVRTESGELKFDLSERAIREIWERGYEIPVKGGFEVVQNANWEDNIGNKYWLWTSDNIKLKG